MQPPSGSKLYTVRKAGAWMAPCHPGGLSSIRRVVPGGGTQEGGEGRGVQNCGGTAAGGRG